MVQPEKKVYQKRKKLNLKVKQDFQIWLLVRIMAVALLTITVASAILYFYAASVVNADYLSHALKVRKLNDVLLPVLLAASLTSTVAGLLLALFLPQKIAGPIFRIEQDLQDIRAGNLNKIINLRSADILKELAESVNITVHDIRDVINDIKIANGELEDKIMLGDIPGTQKALAKQKKCLERLHTQTTS